ncbi:MAG: hypothetical protein RBS81_03500 [Tenuifilaceae bacterium]|jgi:hypothetical protein|nr:hypothetical protein [Tenuifilaceae bacterium]
MEKRPLKWHENFFIGGMLTAFCLMLLFNGFSYLTANYILVGDLNDKMSKNNGLIAIISLIENGWWKYPSILFIAFISIIQFKTGLLKAFGYDYYLSLTTVTEFTYRDYFPFSENMDKKFKEYQNVIIKKHDLKGNIIKEDSYLRGKLSRRKTFKYSNDNALIEENRYNTINMNLEHEQKILYEYQQGNNLKIKKIVYDFYRYGKNGVAGYHKYYYKNGLLDREEIFNHKNFLQGKFIWQRLTENVIIKLRYETKKNTDRIAQINRETYDLKGNRVKLELNFSPKEATDYNFSSVTEYEYDKDNYLIRENNIYYEYLKDIDGFWFYKKTIKDGVPKSCVYRSKKSR